MKLTSASKFSGCNDIDRQRSMQQKHWPTSESCRLFETVVEFCGDFLVITDQRKPAARAWAYIDRALKQRCCVTGEKWRGEILGRLHCTLWIWPVPQLSAMCNMDMDESTSACRFPPRRTGTRSAITKKTCGEACPSMEISHIRRFTFRPQWHFPRCCWFLRLSGAAPASQGSGSPGV